MKARHTDVFDYVYPSLELCEISYSKSLQTFFYSHNIISEMIKTFLRNEFYSISSVYQTLPVLSYFCAGGGASD